MLTSALTQKTKIYIWIFKFCACFLCLPSEFFKNSGRKKADDRGIILKFFKFPSQFRFFSRIQYSATNFVKISATPPLWTDLVKILTRKPRHASSFSLECADFKNIFFEKIPWAPSEVTEVAKVKRPQNPKQRKF